VYNRAERARSAAAAIVRGRKVHPEVRLLVIPSTRQTYAQAIREAGYAVLAVGGTALQVGHNYAFTRGFELFLTDMVDDPAFWHGYAERLTDWAIEYMTAFLEPIATWWTSSSSPTTSGRSVRRS
jgi:hypothetical protein